MLIDDKENINSNQNICLPIPSLSNEIDVKKHRPFIPKQNYLQNSKPQLQGNKPTVRFAVTSSIQDVRLGDPSFTPQEKLQSATPTRTIYAGQTPRFIPYEGSPFSDGSPLLNDDTQSSINMLHQINSSTDYDILKDNEDGIFGSIPQPSSDGRSSTKSANTSDSLSSIRWNLSPPSPHSNPMIVRQPLDHESNQSSLHHPHYVSDDVFRTDDNRNGSSNDAQWDDLQGLLGITNQSPNEDHNYAALQHPSSASHTVHHSYSNPQSNNQGNPLVFQGAIQNSSLQSQTPSTDAVCQPINNTQQIITSQDGRTFLLPAGAVAIPFNPYSGSITREDRLPVTRVWDRFVSIIGNSAEEPIMSPSKTNTSRTLRRTNSTSNLLSTNTSTLNYEDNLSQDPRQRRSDSNFNLHLPNYRDVRTNERPSLLLEGSSVVHCSTDGVVREVARSAFDGRGDATERVGVSTNRPSLSRHQHRHGSGSSNGEPLIRWQDECPAAIPVRKDRPTDPSRLSTALPVATRPRTGCGSAGHQQEVHCPEVVRKEVNIVPVDVAVPPPLITSHLRFSVTETSSSTTMERSLGDTQPARTEEATEVLGQEEGRMGENHMVNVSIQCSPMKPPPAVSPCHSVSPPSAKGSHLKVFESYCSSGSDGEDGDEEVNEVALEDLVGSPHSWRETMSRNERNLAKERSTYTSTTPYTGSASRSAMKPAYADATVSPFSPFTIQKIKLNSSLNKNGGGAFSSQKKSRLGSATRVQRDVYGTQDEEEEDDDAYGDRFDGRERRNDLTDGHSFAVSEAVTTATTLTLEPDDSMLNSLLDPNTVDNRPQERPPKLVAAARRKKDESTDDVKELTVQGRVGVTTTISLKFGNKKSKPQKLTTRAIQMRFDAYDGFKVTANNHVDVDGYEANNELEIVNAFHCTPNKLIVASGEVAELFISFTPDRLGVFSGALKIKSSRKSFVILLRGEAIEDGGDEEPLENPTATATNQPRPNPPQEGVRSQSDRKVRDDSSKPTVVPLTTTSERAFSLVADPEAVLDPLVLRQKWMKSWLLRTKKGAQGQDTMECAYNVGDKHVENPSAVSIMPHTLLLTSPLTVSSEKDREYRRGKSHLLEGALFIRNFSDESLTFVAMSSSPCVRLRCKTATIAAHDDASILVHYEPSLRDHQPLPQTQDPASGHQGYILITTSNGLEFVIEVRAPLDKVLTTLSSERGYDNMESRRVEDETAARNDGRPRASSLSWPSQSAHSIAPSESNSKVSKASKSAKGLYFRQDQVDFGMVGVGSLSRMKVDLCNSTDAEMKVKIEDPSLPFVILHNEVHLQPRSYVRVPVRFLPVVNSKFSAKLQAQSLDGSYKFHLSLKGEAF